jgi:hypothetical protein
MREISLGRGRGRGRRGGRGRILTGSQLVFHREGTMKFPNGNKSTNQSSQRWTPWPLEWRLEYLQILMIIISIPIIHECLYYHGMGI